MTSPEQPNALARSLRRFFAEHMPRARGLSPHTVLSYRDAFALLLAVPRDTLGSARHRSRPPRPRA